MKQRPRIGGASGWSRDDFGPDDSGPDDLGTDDLGTGGAEPETGAEQPQPGLAEGEAVELLSGPGERAPGPSWWRPGRRDAGRSG